MTSHQEQSRAADAEAGNNEAAIDTSSSGHARIFLTCQSTFSKNSFLISIGVAILLAYAYPPLGAVFLAPKIMCDWVAVILIFMLSGMVISAEEFGKVLHRPFFNAYIQLFNFGVVSWTVYGFSRLMLRLNALPQSLADGMVICSCLPNPINSVVVLTKCANGDEALAVFHAAFGIVLGVFISPALITLYLGVSGSVHPLTILVELLLRVAVPLLIGQLLRCFVHAVRIFIDKKKQEIKRAQEFLMAFIVYCVFCETFATRSYSTSSGDFFLMVAMQGGLLILVMVLAWSSLGMLFSDHPKLRAMGLFGCTNKNVSLGIPLIKMMYTNDPLIGFYTLPLLLWYLMQVFLGIGVAPRVAKYVLRREAELLTMRHLQEPLLPLATEACTARLT